MHPIKYVMCNAMCKYMWENPYMVVYHTIPCKKILYLVQCILKLFVKQMVSHSNTMVLNVYLIHILFCFNTLMWRVLVWKCLTKLIIMNYSRVIIWPKLYLQRTRSSWSILKMRWCRGTWTITRVYQELMNIWKTWRPSHMRWDPIHKTLNKWKSNPHINPLVNAPWEMQNGVNLNPKKSWNSCLFSNFRYADSITYNDQCALNYSRNRQQKFGGSMID